MCLYGEGRVNKAAAAGRFGLQKEAGLEMADAGGLYRQ